MAQDTMDPTTATVECSFHDGHPEVASQYAGRYWAWTPELPTYRAMDGTQHPNRDDVTFEVNQFVRGIMADAEPMSFEDGTTRDPIVDVIWDGALNGMVEALYVCSAEDHEGEDCSCYVWRVEFRTTFDA